jgi:hypothetical protein
MPARMLLLTALCAATLATAQPDGGPRKATADAGTTAKKGTTVPDRTPPSPPAGAELPAPRTQTTPPVGTGSETPPPTRANQPVPTPRPEVPPITQPPSPTPH